MSRLNRLQHMALVKVIPQCDMANSTHTIHCCGISAAQQPLQFIGDLVCGMGGAHVKRAQTPWTVFVLLADPSALHHPYTLRHTYTHMRYCTLPPPPSNCQRDDTSGFGSSLKYATSSVAHRRGGGSACPGRVPDAPGFTICLDSQIALRCRQCMCRVPPNVPRLDLPRGPHSARLTCSMNILTRDAHLWQPVLVAQTIANPGSATPPPPKILPACVYNMSLQPSPLFLLPVHPIASTDDTQ